MCDKNIDVFVGHFFVSTLHGSLEFEVFAATQLLAVLFSDTIASSQPTNA